MNHQVALLKIFDAIQDDNHIAVQNVLNETLKQKLKLPSLELSGIIILAAESKAHKVAQEIYLYNYIVKDLVVAKYIHIAKRFLQKNKITIH